MTRAIGWLLLIGATAGPVLDGLHTFSGATWYAHPQVLRSVWWCPPLFAAAAVAIGGGRLLTERLLGRALDRPSGLRTAFAMGTFVVAYVLSGFLPVGEIGRALVLAIMFLLAWWRFDRTALGFALALLTGFGGWLVEHTLVGAGLFGHAGTLLDGIAAWIPPLYFLAAIAIGVFAKWLAAPAQ